MSLCKILCDNCSDNTNDVKIFSKGETKNNLNKDNLKKLKSCFRSVVTNVNY